MIKHINIIYILNHGVALRAVLEGFTLSLLSQP